MMSSFKKHSQDRILKLCLAIFVEPCRMKLRLHLTENYLVLLKHCLPSTSISVAWCGGQRATAPAQNYGHGKYIF